MGRWTRGELIAYNITISSLLPDEFFLVPNGPDPSLDHIEPAVLNSPPGDNNSAISSAAVTFLDHLHIAQRAPVGDFAAQTLRLLDFDNRDVIVFRCLPIPLTIHGNRKLVQADVCLLHHTSLILLVLIVDKAVNSEPQVVASAIGAFQSNNQRRKELQLALLDSMTIPCISMTGTHPTFYLVPVTTQLSDAVTSGQYPTTQTQVLQCATVAPRPSIGMEDLNYRRLALKHFLAFKALAQNHMSHIVDGV